MTTMGTVDAYPLAWPMATPRTDPRDRQRGAFKVTMARARDELLRGLRLLEACDVVISSMVPVRQDGIPYASWRGGLRENDPGVAVYWMRGGEPFVMACDRYEDVIHNLRAVGLTVEAIRAIERHGSTHLRDRAFAGFRALPASTKRPWRDVLGFDAGAAPTATQIREHFRARAKRAHPDVGGSKAAMDELTKAQAEGLAEIERKYGS